MTGSTTTSIFKIIGSCLSQQPLKHSSQYADHHTGMTTSSNVCMTNSYSYYLCTHTCLSDAHNHTHQKSAHCTCDQRTTLRSVQACSETDLTL